MPARPSTIQYRYVKLDGLWPAFDLKAMVVDILRRADAGTGAPIGSMARLRKKDLDQDGSYVVLNKLSAPETWDGPTFCGQLIHVKSGASLPGLSGSLDDDTAEFVLQQLTFEQLTQIVEGVLYFAIVGNHVGLIEGQRARGRTLERYLTRFLQDAGELEAGQTVILNTSLQGQVTRVSQIELKPHRSKAPPLRDAAAGTDAAAEEGEGATVLKVLEVLGWSPDQLQMLEARIPEGGWLEGIFRVRMKGAGRKKATVDRAVLEEALRNLDDKSVGLLGDGGREKGGLIRLSDRRQVVCDGDLLDPTDAMAQIVEALRRWSEDGKINCNFQ